MPPSSPLTILAYAWRRLKGWVDVPACRNDQWYERWYEWPKESKDVVSWIKAANRKGACVYWSPLVYPEPSRRSAYSCTSLWAWSDLDRVNPRKLDPEPTILWRTSPGRYQGLYRLEEEVSAEELEELNKRIAHANGGDPSGWDASQVLRVPGSRNYKYTKKPKGKVIAVTGLAYSTSDIKEYNLPPSHVDLNKDVPVGTYTYKQALETYDNLISWEARGLLEANEDEVQQGTRSTRLYTLMRYLARDGVSAAGIYALVQGSVWNKFAGRADEEERLKKEIAKALSMEVQEEGEDEGDIEAAATLEVSDGEAEVDKAYEPPFKSGWLYEYCKAAALYAPHADPRFHIGCGLSLLSATLGRFVQTGRIRRAFPVIYTKLISPSRSGKSDAMEFAMRVFEAAGMEEYIKIVVTCSPEGLQDALLASPVKQVWIWNGEINGVMKLAKDVRSYGRGLLDLLKQGYDGATLRHEVRRNPVRISGAHISMLAASQPEPYCELMDDGDIESGYLARVMHYYSNTPGSPSYDETDPYLPDLSGTLAKQLQELRQVFTSAQAATPFGTYLYRHTGPVIADVTTDAKRYWQEVSHEVTKPLSAPGRDPRMDPLLMERPQQFLRVATLLAASQLPEVWAGGFEVDRETMEQAVAVVQEQSGTAEVMFQNLGSSPWNKQVEKVSAYVAANRKVPRSVIARNFHRAFPNKFEVDRLRDTLKDRGLIRVKLEYKDSGARARQYGVEMWIATRRAVAEREGPV